MNENDKPSESESLNPNLPITKQTAGGVTGAVVGGMIAGPIGAIVGGVAGAMMGNRVEHGQPAIPEGAVAAAQSMAQKVQKSSGAKKVKALAKTALVKAHLTGPTAKKVAKGVKTAAKKVKKAAKKAKGPAKKAVNAAARKVAKATAPKKGKKAPAKKSAQKKSGKKPAKKSSQPKAKKRR